MPGRDPGIHGVEAPPGSAGFDRALSGARARDRGPRDAGVPTDPIRVGPRGAAPSEAAPAESRCVEIAVGG